MTAYVPAVALVAWLAALPFLVERTLRRTGLVRPNFQGSAIPVGYGLVVLLWAAPAMAWIAWVLPDRRREMAAFATIVVGMGLLGLADDIWGSRRETGFRGHVRALLSHGRVTTGLLKAVGGTGLALLVTRWMLGDRWTDAVLDGAIVALSANALNLLDLRPGRACALFLAASLAPLSAAFLAGRVPALAPIWIPALLVYERDARAKVMLGDSGANLLGGSLGLALILAFPGLAIRMALLAALVSLHVAAERVSISTVIERASLLRRIDGFTGVR